MWPPGVVTRRDGATRPSARPGPRALPARPSAVSAASARARPRPRVWFWRPRVRRSASRRSGPGLAHDHQPDLAPAAPRRGRPLAPQASRARARRASRRRVIRQPARLAPHAHLREPPGTRMSWPGTRRDSTRPPVHCPSQACRAARPSQVRVRQPPGARLAPVWSPPQAWPERHARQRPPPPRAPAETGSGRGRRRACQCLAAAVRGASTLFEIGSEKDTRPVASS